MSFPLIKLEIQLHILKQKIQKIMKKSGRNRTRRPQKLERLQSSPPMLSSLKSLFSDFSDAFCRAKLGIYSLWGCWCNQVHFRYGLGLKNPLSSIYRAGVAALGLQCPWFFGQFCLRGCSLSFSRLFCFVLFLFLFFTRGLRP